MKTNLNGVRVTVRARTLALRDACSRAPVVSVFERELAKFQNRRAVAAVYRGRVRT